MFKQNYVLNYVPENLNTRGFVERGFVAPLSSMLREEELELYSHILAGLKPLVQGRLDSEAR